MFDIDRSFPVALPMQIETKLRAMVDSRSLPGGVRMMSIRQLAVSANTVVLAYDRLVATGVIESERPAPDFVGELFIPTWRTSPGKRVLR